MGESRIERGGGRLELPPKLRLERVTARTIGEAMDKTRKNGAGDDELQEMHAWLNKNKSSDTANSWKPTFNFFPNARHAGDRWLGSGRSVVKD